MYRQGHSHTAGGMPRTRWGTAMFSTFFTTNYPPALRLAERRLSSRDDAEEVVTEAFRIMWERSVAGGSLSVPWLYGVLRNLVGNEYRRRLRSAELRRTLADDLRIVRPRADDACLDVRDALLRLPPLHREVLVMTYWGRLTDHEIAGALEITPAAVRSRLTRARALLRSTLLADHVTESRLTVT